MKYKKYNHVDLSNIKQISGNNVELNKIPEWIPLCRNLKIILLEHNNLKGEIKKEQLPPNLTHIDFTGNQITSIDISGLNNLYSLKLNKNQFGSFDLGYTNTL